MRKKESEEDDDQFLRGIESKLSRVDLKMNSKFLFIVQHIISISISIRNGDHQI
jgi:hypothetical protein